MAPDQYECSDWDWGRKRPSIIHIANSPQPFHSYIRYSMNVYWSSHSQTHMHIHTHAHTHTEEDVHTWIFGQITLFPLYGIKGKSRVHKHIHKYNQYMYSTPQHTFILHWKMHQCLKTHPAGTVPIMSSMALRVLSSQERPVLFHTQ